MLFICRYTILKMHSKWLLMANEMIYHCFMGVTSITRAHVHDTFITQTFEEKILYSFKLNIFYEKSFPDIYDIQIELEQSKVGQNEMVR